MKRIYLLLVLCMVAIGLAAQNIVAFSSVQGQSGEEVTVTMSLQNVDAISAIQIRMPLGDNLTYVEGSAKVDNSRCANHSISAGVKDSQLNIMLYSTGMKAINGSDGQIASFRLRLGNQPGGISIYPSEVIMTGTKGNDLSGSSGECSVIILCAKAEYSEMTVDFGKLSVLDTGSKDINVTNVGNADLIITGLDFSKGDVFSCSTSFPITISSGDSKLLSIDCSPKVRGSIDETMKVICNSVSKLNTIALKAEAFTVNELHIQSVEGIADEEVTVSMIMNNMDAVNGCQVIFDMPDELEYVNGSFTLSNRTADHISTASQSGRTLQLVIYSQTGKAFIGNDGEIGSFKVKLVGRNSVELKPSKTVLSATINNKVENVLSDFYGGMVTINSPRISSDGYLNFGAVPVTEAAEKTYTIYNYGNATLNVNRIVFDNENLSIKETLPLTVDAGGSRSVTVVYSSVEQTNFDSRMQIYSNDPDLRMKEVNVTGSRFAPNYLEVATKDVSPSENLVIDFSLSTYDAVKGLQFDVSYPGQYYTTFDENCTLEARAEGMTVNIRQTDTNTFKVFCYFLNGGGITSGEGKIMSLLLKPVGESVPEGSYTVKVKNIKFGTDELADKYAGADCESSFKVKEVLPVTITAKSYTIAYGDEIPTFEYTSEGEMLEGEPSISCEATKTSSVGTYTIVISKGSVTNKKDTYVNGTLTIEKASLTITAKDYTIKQGEALPTFEATYEGFKNGETSDVLTKQPTIATTATSGSDLGNYDITVSSAEAQNYEISYVNGHLTIVNADALVITAKSYTIEYGDEIPTFEYTSEGTTLSGTPSITCEAKKGSPAGTYDIVISKGSVTNYNDTYVNGKLTIEKAPLTITAKDYTIKQGEALPTFEATYEGFRNNETSAVLTKQPTITTTATSASAIGEYDINVSGAEAQNYDISYVKGKLTIVDADALVITAKSYTIEYGDEIPTFKYTSEGTTLSGTPSITCEAKKGSPAGTYDIVISKGSVTNYNDTYVNGKLTITKAPLKITAKNYTIKQGETLPNFEATYEGFKNDETSSVFTKQPTFSCSAKEGSSPGTYDIVVSGTEAKNYSFTYVKGKLTVTKADPVTVTAKSYEITYGDALPEYEYTSTGAALNGTPTISCAATAKSPAGTYPITIKKGSVTNYNDKYVNGTLTIKKAPLTIKAGEYTKKQGEDNPEFTLTYEGFKHNETETVLTKKPTVSTLATKDSEPGDYDVTVSGAEAQNYEISYVKGKLTIQAPDLLPGDANGDGKVDAADIADIVNYMMGKPTSTGKFSENAADVNDDNVVNVADIVKIANIIMGQ